MAVICVKSGTVLWSTANDEQSHFLAPWGSLVTLNRTTIAYITLFQMSLRPILCVRDILTGDIKATKPVPDGLILSKDLFTSRPTEGISFQLHPRRDLVYIAVRGNAFFFSTTTANCVGRLSAANVFSLRSFFPYSQAGPPRFRFSERPPKCSPSTREKFFLYQSDRSQSDLAYYCLEYEAPADEDISISEAGILQNGDKGSEENLISKVLRIQIYERRALHREGPLELDPMTKQLAHTECSPVYESGYTQVRFHSFTRKYPLSEGSYGVSLESEESEEPQHISTPIEFYPQDSRDVLVTKPKRPLGRLRRRSERADCLLPKSFAAPITLTERYMFLMHLNDVYLFSYEPGW